MSKIFIAHGNGTVYKVSKDISKVRVVDVYKRQPLNMPLIRKPSVRSRSVGQKKWLQMAL